MFKNILSCRSIGPSLAALCVVMASHGDVHGAVNVAQNQGTNWVGAPTIMVTNYPAVYLNSAESTWGNGIPSLGQSFTAPVSGTLSNIQMYVTGKNTTNVLYLYDMGVAMRYAAAQPTSIIPGSNGVSGNLLSSNLSIVISNQSGPSVMRLTFSGADAVELIGGHEYLFNVVSLNSANQTYWHRSGGGVDLYAGGAAYRQNSLINSSKTTDFSLAVSLVNTSAAPVVYNCVIDWTNTYQRIDGFGASSAWRSQWRSDMADMLFSTNNGTCSTLSQNSNFTYTGIGLSLLRTRINTNGTTTWENSIMQMAQARGAKVWSTPWTPPPHFKSNGNVNGGNFLSVNNQAYASVLAQYVVNMKNLYGIDIYALSVQNEPDLATSYESCVWTPQQIRDFVPFLRNALVASNKSSVKIIAAEDQHWQTNYYAAALSDPASATNISIIACHNYDNSPPSGIPAALPRYANPNAVLWETEVSKLAGNGPFDPGMGDAMYWAGRLHLFMNVANVSAWHYWWLISNNPDNEGLTDTNGIPAKRMYVLGQYSRFVRPDFYRIDEGNNNPYAVLASAYKDPASGKFAIVVTSTNSTATAQAFQLANFSAASVTPWITSSNLSLASQPPVAVSNSVFSYVIPPMSVVTFEGVAASSPTNITISSSTLGENQSIGASVGDLGTSDPDPGDTFTYMLVAGAGGTDNGSFSISGSNLLTAASFDHEVQNSFSVRIRSTDQGGLFFEKAFAITITNLNEAPELAGVSDVTVNPGVIVTLTNSVSDPELPAQALTFSLLSAPTNATLTSLDASNALFTWRPLISQAASTNPIQVKVTDSGAPNLSVTNHFIITVEAASQPVLESITLESQVSLSATGMIGPDYSLFTSTDLLDWQLLFTTNPTTMPVTFTDTNLNDAVRFYRLQLGP
jgi:glucuronoarabinoxylan endo-1,4-beta-xylanase